MGSSLTLWVVNTCNFMPILGVGNLCFSCSKTIQIIVSLGASSAVPWVCVLALRTPEKLAFPSSVTLNLL